MSDTSTVEEQDNAGFTTLAPEHWPGKVLPEGMTYVTTEEMGFLKAWSWGENSYRATCEACSNEMIFEKHPADWPNHPGEPGQLRVKIECNACGHMQWTDGATEQDFSRDRLRAMRADVEAEMSRRLAAADGGTVEVDGTDGGAGGDVTG
jgi:hypothetical protein